MFKIKKLWIKIFLYLLLIAFLSTLVTTLLHSLFLDNLFWRFMKSREAERDRTIVQLVENTYKETGDWEKVENITPSVCMTMNACIKIVDNSGKMIFDYCVNTPGAATHYSDEKARVYPLSSEGKKIGDIYINSEPHRWVWNSQMEFYQRVMHTVIFLTSLFAFVAISLGAPILARIIVKHINSLKDSIHRYSKGDKSIRATDIPPDEIGDLAKAFNEMVEKISYLESYRQRMTSDLAHDLRTPLANMKAILEGMEDDIVETNPETLKSLQEEVEGLTTLVEDLQELSNLEDPDLKLTLEHHFLDSILSETLDRIKPAFTEKGIKVSLETGGKSPTVNVDKKRMGRVFYNILHNALKFTPPEGEVFIRIYSEDAMAKASIRDEGEGIADKDLPFIFDRFYKADKARSGKSTGRGLGLAIAKNIVEAHSGRIEVRSQIGKGTKFIVSLPAGESA